MDDHRLRAVPDLSTTRRGTQRPLERSQVVWRRAVELAAAPEEKGPYEAALDLLRAAHHDPAMTTRALVLGRARLRDHSGDVSAERGVRLLERAIRFLGVQPQPGKVGPARKRHG